MEDLEAPKRQNLSLLSSIDASKEGPVNGTIAANMKTYLVVLNQLLYERKNKLKTM